MGGSMLRNMRGQSVRPQVNSFGIASRIMKHAGQRNRPRAFLMLSGPISECIS